MIKTNTNNGINNILGGNNMKITNVVEGKKERALDSLYVGNSINKVELEKIGGAINCVKLENKQKALAAMSYSYGSLVGVTTTGMALGLTLMSHPEQYFNAAGKIELYKIRKALKKFGKERKPGTRYNSVFVNQVNKDAAINKFGRFAEFARISIHEVKEFDNRIKSLDYAVVTVEDLYAIAKDLDVIGRAMQELAIDVTKDKTKDIGYNVMSFIEVKSKTLSRIIKHGDFTNNIQTIIDKHFDGKNIDIKYSLTPDVKVKLANADVTSRNSIATAVVEDISGDMMEAINEGYTEGFDSLIDLFKLSNHNMYNRFIEIIETARKVNSQSPVAQKKIAHMVKCARVALNSVNNLYGAKQLETSINSDYVSEVGKKLRAGLYTEGAKIGFDPVAVVVISIAAAFCNLTDGRITKKKTPSLTALWNIFPKEFIIDYVGGKGSNRQEVIRDMLTVKTASYDLCLNDELVFDEGMAETEYGFVIVKENYTGKAIVTEEGIQAIVNHYAYEPTEVMFIESVYEKNVMTTSEAYKRPTTFLQSSVSLIDPNATVHYNTVITSMVKSAEQYKFVGYTDNSKDLVIKKGDKISVIGKILSFTKTTSKINDAIVGSNGAVVFFNN